MNDFEESAHLSSDGTFDMHAIMKALYDTGFDGIIRPDHGRMIWGEKAMLDMVCMTEHLVLHICAVCGSQL